MTSQLKILAIDDESDVLLIVRTALESEDYEVFTASNGEDGLALASEENPDLIVLDVMMPEIDGFEVLQRLKDTENTANIPVVMLTGLSDNNLIKKALDLGVRHYVVKPFEFREFIDIVHSAMEDHDINMDIL